MLLNIHFQKYCYSFENYTFQRYLVLHILTNPDRLTLVYTHKKGNILGKKQFQFRCLHTTL